MPRIKFGSAGHLYGAPSRCSDHFLRQFAIGSSSASVPRCVSPNLARLRPPAMSAVWSLLRGKQTRLGRSIFGND